MKLATTLKHYAVNNKEVERHSLSATVSERMLMEYYLPHFKAGIIEGGATSIMSSPRRDETVRRQQQVSVMNLQCYIIHKL